MQSGGADESKIKLIDLTKQNALLEVNLNKMTRQSNDSNEELRLLKRNYDFIENDMSEMETAFVHKINELKTWKRNATFQLKQLYEQLKVAAPLGDYE
jgi:prolyl oligopeptidase PreP (S9A serine peptidase family)